MLMGYWKRFAALGTGFARNYRYDPFFRTELNVIGLQVVFTALLILIVVEGVTYLYQDISTELVSGLTNILKAHSVASTSDIAQNLNDIRVQNLVIMGGLIATGTAIFAYLITRLALAPARNALEAQKQFIGNIAHELRTPLAVIKTNTEVSLIGNNVSDEVRGTLTDTIEELDRISDIINNLLSMNALVRPEKMVFANVDIGAVVDRMKNHLESLIAKKRLELTVTKTDYRTVWGNLTALEQVVMNVLKNAVNYTPSGGKVKIVIEPDYRGHITVAIEDSGIGIDEKDLKQIFEPFFRADQSRVRVNGGSGLGLAIVSELVKLHQGSITIRSVKDRGTTVLISLPCGRDERKGKLKNRNDAAEIAMDYSK